MESALLWLTIGFGLLLAVAMAVAALEHVRNCGQLRRARAAAMAEHAAATLAAVFDAPKPPARAAPLPAAPALPATALQIPLRTASVTVAEHRAPLNGALRRMAHPAVGPASSGWLETEPMVLSGAGRDHFDPTEHARR